MALDKQKVMGKDKYTKTGGTVYSSFPQAG